MLNQQIKSDKNAIKGHVSNIKISEDFNDCEIFKIA